MPIEVEKEKGEKGKKDKGDKDVEWKSDLEKH